MGHDGAATQRPADPLNANRTGTVEAARQDPKSVLGACEPAGPTKKKAFVTGATGFVSLNLIEELCSAGYEVTALHRPTSDLQFLGRLDANRVVGTITDKATLEAVMEEGVDVFFHVAANTNVWARNNDTQTRDNVDGTRNMVNVALQETVRQSYVFLRDERFL